MPPSKKGAAKNDRVCKTYPAIDGDTACAIFLEIFVIPAAAVLSFSLTTTTVYDCLVGTSICDRAILARYNAMANGSVGANATSIIKILDGICVNTIVFIKPILAASLAATRNEKAVRTPAIEKIRDRVVNSTPNLVKNQNDTIL